jgi:methyltransferase (TIGR00027 family)
MSPALKIECLVVCMMDNDIEPEKSGLKRSGPSKMAAGIAMHRAHETQKPEDERICCDPYAFRFMDPAILQYAAAYPKEAQEKYDEMEKLFPGLGNSIRARVRYFDDFVEKFCGDGLEQLVVLGAGYDTRAYRLKGLNESVRVFEVDHPDTQAFKAEKIREIFGRLPDHVVYVPIDFESEDLGDRLLANGYSPAKKTLFLLEGLIMYLPPEAVDETLAFIRNHSGPGSEALFDYYPLSAVDGTDTRPIAANIRYFTRQQGEPLKSGIPDGEVEAFLAARGFSNVRNVTGKDYRRMYFHGKNASRQVCDLLSFVSAEVR